MVASKIFSSREKPLVIDLKSVKALKLIFVAPTPEQNGTPPMQFGTAPREPY